MKIFNTIFYTFFIILIMGVALLFLAPLLPLENNIAIKIVESGSMEPSIMTGSLVVVVPRESYVLQDVITFESTAADIPTTHRIIGREEQNGVTFFTTKGDANEEADTQAVSEVAVIGKVMVAVPYAGFVLDFARQPLGFLFLIVLPACMIILGEIEKIWSEIKNKRRGVLARKGGHDAKPHVKEQQEAHNTVTRLQVRMIDIATPVRYAFYDVRRQELTQSKSAIKSNKILQEFVVATAIVVVSLFFASLSFIGSTVSYFNDSESSLLNSLQAELLDFTVQADGHSFGFIGNELDDQDGALLALVTPLQGSTNIRYEVSTLVAAGDPLFCDAIVVDAGAPLVFQGKLVDLSGSDVNFSGDWSLALTLDGVSGPFAPGTLCEIDIVYTGWNTESAAGVGYYDEEVVSLMFFAPVENAPLMAPFTLFSAQEEGTGEGEETQSEEPMFEEPMLEELPTEGEELLEEEEVEETQETEDEQEEIEEQEEVEEIKEQEEDQTEEPESAEPQEVIV